MKKFKLDDILPEHEQSEEKGLYTFGDKIVNSFFNGQFSFAVKELKKYDYKAIDFLNYLENISENTGFYSVTDQGFYNGRFSCEFWVALGSEV